MSDDYPFFSAEHPIRFAHRGSRHLAPENTMHAFSLAVDDLDYRYVETDVRLTRDRVVVVFHDATLEHTTNGVGRVSDWLWEDLQHLDAAYWYGADRGFPLRGRGIGIPSLEEVYRTWPGLHLNLDLKAAREEWAVAEVVRGEGREHTTLVGAFRDHRVSRFRRITRGSVATSAGPSAAVAMYAASRVGRTSARPAPAYQLPFDYRGLRVDRRLIDAVHRSGSQIHLWTVNERMDMEHFLDLGVDGIVTDRPDILNEVMEARSERPAP